MWSVGYAAMMLLGLRTWWLAAVVTPFLRLHMTAMSLLIGCLSGLLVAQAAIEAMAVASHDTALDRYDIERLSTRFESFMEEFSNILQRQAAR